MVMTVFYGILGRLDRSVGSGVARLISGKSFNISEFSSKEKQ